MPRKTWSPRAMVFSLSHYNVWNNYSNKDKNGSRSSYYLRRGREDCGRKVTCGGLARQSLH